jgi:hypothetical protein
VRFRLGPVPDNPAFHPENEGWTRLDEPSFGRLMVLAVPLSVLLTAGMLFAWGAVARAGGMDAEVRVAVTPAVALEYLLVFAALVLAHELAHAVSLPQGGRSASTTLGFWPRVLTPYVSHQRELSRKRQIAVALAPFLLLSVVPVAAGFLLSSAPAWLVALSVLNAFSSSGDLIGAGLAVSRIPASAVVRNKGYETWWRVPA